MWPGLVEDGVDWFHGLELSGTPRRLAESKHVVGLYSRILAGASGEGSDGIAARGRAAPIGKG